MIKSSPMILLKLLKTRTIRLLQFCFSFLAKCLCQTIFLPPYFGSPWLTTISLLSHSFWSKGGMSRLPTRPAFKRITGSYSYFKFWSRQCWTDEWKQACLSFSCELSCHFPGHSTQVFSSFRFTSAWTWHTPKQRSSVHCLWGAWCQSRFFWHPQKVSKLQRGSSV